MEIDRKQLEKASSLSEEQLKQLIYQVVLAAGGSKAKAQMASGRADVLKEKLKTVTDEELQGLVSSVPPEKMNAIVNALKKGEKQGE